MASDRDDERLAAPGNLELIRDFVNTLDVLPGTEGIEDTVGLTSWLEERRLVPTRTAFTDDDLARARVLREALRALLMANAGFPLSQEAAEAFDTAAGTVRLRARAEEEGRVKLLPGDADEMDHAIGRLLSIVVAAQESGAWTRLKACAECHWALYDHTKNRSAAWCGSQCGARVRARRRRRRRRKDLA